MADDADRASDLIELELSTLLAVRRPAASTYTGRCQNCAAHVARPLQFCDADCRDDFEREKKRRRFTAGEGQVD